MKRRKMKLRRLMSTVGAFTIAVSLCGGSALATEGGNNASVLEIVSVESENEETSTGQQSSVTSVTYKLNGEEKTVSVDEDSCYLTLVVDGAQENITEGKIYRVDESYDFVEAVSAKKGGPSCPPWDMMKEGAKFSTYFFRQALLVNNNQVVNESSVTQAITGGSYDGSSADGVTVTSNGSHFNGLYVTGNSNYAIKNAKVYANGDGGDDFSGWGAAVMADEDTNVTISDSLINTLGTIRTAIWVGGNSKTTVSDSVIYAQETEDDYETYSELVPAMMKRVPFALGMEGTIRATNVLGAGQAIYKDSIIVSTGWGALSTDSGTAYSQTKTYALNVSDSLGGIGTLEVAKAGKNYTATKTVNGVTYGFTVGGSGYVTYADSGVNNLYTNVEFYSPDYVQILASGEASSTYNKSKLYSERIAFMTQQAGGGTLTLKDSTVDTKDALMQIKSGQANKGTSNLVVDNTKVNFSGDSKRTEDGILVELVESDDAGNPGVYTYTVNDKGDEAEQSSTTHTDSNATFKNGEYEGDIWNSIYYFRQALNVSLEDADLTGTVSSSVAVHVDPETGDTVENGTVLNAYTGSETYDSANYLGSYSLSVDPDAVKIAAGETDDLDASLAYGGGTSGDYLTIGSFSHEASEIVNNPINLTMDKDSTWTVTGDGYLNSLTVASLDDIEQADGASYTIYTGDLTVGDTDYEDGTYKSAGGVAIIVKDLGYETEDTGVAASGTLSSGSYTIKAQDEDGNPMSKAVSVKTVNGINGVVYYSAAATEGYEIVNTKVENGADADTSSSYNSENYPNAYAPSSKDTPMTITITVKAASQTDTSGAQSGSDAGIGSQTDADSAAAADTADNAAETADDTAAVSNDAAAADSSSADDGQAAESTAAETAEAAEAAQRDVLEVGVNETSPFSGIIKVAGSGQTYSYESWNDGIATVNEDGTVTGAAKGETYVTVTAYVDGTEVDSVDVPVTVTEAQAASNPEKDKTTPEKTNTDAKTDTKTDDKKATPTKTAKTSDSSMVWIWGAAAAAAGLAAGSAAYRRKRVK